MPQTPNDAAEIPLNVFAGYCSYMDPAALPAGASPWCNDMCFQPGGTQSRPGLQKYFATSLGNVTVVSGHSYVDPSKIVRNLVLDSAGNLWIQNVTAATLPTVALTTTPGSYAKFSTAFGRVYIAFSNGLVGTDIPYQITGLPDGTIQIDRITQDGPGAPPTISNLIIPPTDISNTTGTINLTITEVDPENPDPNSGFFTSINVYTTTSVSSVQVGQFGVISGTGTAFDGTWGPITAVFAGSPNLIQMSAYIPSGTVFWTGSASMLISTAGLVRNNNIVTATTTAAHQLQPGYQVQITNCQAASVGDSVTTPTDTTIVINNENLPGLATVTVGLASGQVNHGLVPGNQVSISGVEPATVGTSISSIVRAAQVVTVVMSASTGLSPGAIVTISGVTPASFNGIWQVLNVTTTTNSGDTFTYAQVDVDVASSNGGGSGTTAINWADSILNDLFTVVAAPTPTTFQIAVNYPDGTWTTGSITFAFDGTFFVQTVPSSTTFTYQQYGPNATGVAVSGNIVVTPYGQAAPGQHQMQVFFIDRQGGITAPSPPVTFIANGGQYLSINNIPTGPSPHIVARGLAFTGAQGAFFYYIPSPPQTNGQLVGTSTVINDNTTTGGVVLDFSDPTLFDALGVSTQGNNLANQVVIDGALGFGYYGSRLATYGQRNIVDNLLNMTFDGGSLPNMPTVPSGWAGGGAGTITAGHYGFGWQTSATALTQSMYEDSSGAPIATANSLYTFRAWLSAAGTCTATISSVSTSFSSTVTLTAIGAGFLQANFSAAMPNVIPSDLILGITGSGIVVDELNIVYTQNPVLNTMLMSYTNNPEGMDGVSGVIGPVNDTHQVLNLFILRDNLYMLTRDPQGRLHEAAQGITEPADWDVVQVGSSSGTVSAFACTVSQADDSTGTGAPAWAAYYSFNGFMIFGGDEPQKISQEIQRPQGSTFPGAPTDLTAVNQQSLLTVWALNDPYNKIVYLGLPIGSAGVDVAPNEIYALTYTGLDSAGEIIGNPPIHKSLSGKLVATDLGRKWCPYKLPMNGAALMYQPNGTFAPTFFGGTGIAPNMGGTQQFGNMYTLNPNYYSDDDYGQLSPLYTTYGFPDRDTEQQMNLGGGMKMISYGECLMSGVGYGTITFLYNTLANVWPIAMNGYLLSEYPNANLEFGGGQCTAQRFFFQFTVSPDAAGSTAHPAIDNAFGLSVLVPALRKNDRMLVRGSYP